MSAGKQSVTTAFWGMVINNYTQTHLALLRQGYPDHLKQLVYTLEEGGEEGTPHVQAYLRLFRQQRLSYVKKLFPGANFQPLNSDEYILHAQAYAQKLDDTARSPAAITNNPMPDPVDELLECIEASFADPDLNQFADRPHIWAAGQPTRERLLQWLQTTEFKRVRKSPRLAKFYVSAVYRKIKEEYLDALKAFVFDRVKSEDTHTHTQDEKFSRRGGITDDQSASQDGTESEGDYEEGGTEGDESYGDEDCEATSADDSGSGGSDCS